MNKLASSLQQALLPYYEAWRRVLPGAAVDRYEVLRPAESLRLAARRAT